jgi:hypothetical protein
MGRRSLLLLAAGLFLIAGPGDDSARVELKKPSDVKEFVRQFQKAVERGKDANLPLNLAVGRPVELPLDARPVGIQVVNPKVLDYEMLGPQSLHLFARAPGSTAFKAWFPDPKVRGKNFTLNVAVTVLKEEKKGDRKPVPNRESLEQFKKAVERRADAEVPFDLVLKQPVRIPMKEQPFRIQLVELGVVDYKFLDKRTLELEGRATGRRLIKMWFGDPGNRKKQFVLTLPISVREKSP